MAGGKLTVEIGADKTDFDKKIKEVEFDIKELSKVKLEQLKVGLDTTQINAQIKDAKASLNSLKTTVKDTGSTFTGMAPKVANGGNALMQFSRIAQDAPYGIIGIGNNITATVEAFGHLKNSTGSTGGALKALGQSIMGSGGILLGVSLLTTGLTYMAQSGLTVGDVIDKLTGETNAYSDALKKATSEAYTNQSVVQAAEDVKQLTNEVQLAKDGFLNKNKVVEHYNDTMGKTTGIVKTLDEVEQQLVKNGAAYIQMLLYKATATLAQGEAAKELLKRENLSKNETQKHLGVLEYFLIASGQSVNIITAMSGAEKNRKEAVNGSTKAMNANLSVAEKYNKMAAEIAKIKGFNFFEDNETKKVKPKKSFVTPQVAAITQPMISAPLVDVNTIAVFNGQIDALGGKVKELPGVIKASLAMLPEEVSASLVAMTQALMDFNARAGEIISGALVDTFAGIGSAIGNALASGGNVLKAIGGSLLSSLGGLLTDMGKMAIQVGVGLLAIKTALKSLNPAVAIGAGVALIALGSFFSSKSSSIGGSVGGGGKGASSSSGSGANNQSFTSSGFSGGGNNGGTVVFEIAGQKLIGVLSNTLNANRRLGGQLGL
jgi:hypothetical protein